MDVKNPWYVLNKDNIVWMDMEMSGLNIDKDHIMEVACIVTDSNLNIIAEGPDLIIHQSDDTLNTMDEWCTNQHGESGLTESSRKSTIDIKRAENDLLAFIQKYAPEKMCPLAGNSIYMDRLFLRKFMPKVDNYLHYRIIDISTVKELCRRWYINEYKNMPMKKFTHRSLADIKESIEELKYYKESIYISK